MRFYELFESTPNGHSGKLNGLTVMSLDQFVDDDELKEFAPGGDFKPPMPPKGKGDDPWGNDDRSKIVQAVRGLLKAGNKVDWKVPGQMGHVVRPYSKIHYSLHLTDDYDDKYMIKMKNPGHYVVVSSDPEWQFESVTEAEFGLGANYRKADDAEMQDFLHRAKTKTKTKRDKFDYPLKLKARTVKLTILKN